MGLDTLHKVVHMDVFCHTSDIHESLAVPPERNMVSKLFRLLQLKMSKYPIFKKNI